MKNQQTYTLKQDLAKRLNRPGFRQAWDESAVEFQLACKLIEIRLAKKMSQRDLAKRVNTSQAAISRLEGMDGNPSLLLLKRVAEALDTTLVLDFK